MVVLKILEAYCQGRVKAVCMIGCVRLISLKINKGMHKNLIQRQKSGRLPRFQLLDPRLLLPDQGEGVGAQWFAAIPWCFIGAIFPTNLFFHMAFQPLHTFSN